MTEMKKVSMLLKTAAETIKQLEAEVSSLKNNETTRSVSYGNENAGIGTVVNTDDYVYNDNPKENSSSIFG